MIAILATALVAVGVITVFAWSPWVQPTEVEWLSDYEAWSDEIDAVVADGRTVFPAACEATFEEAVGSPPTERLRETAAVAVTACSDVTPRGRRAFEARVVRALMAVHGELLPPRPRPDLSEIVRTSVGVEPEVYCWPPAGWATFSEHHAIVRGGEVASLDGVGDPARRRVDLAPGACATLTRYVRGVRPLPLSSQNLQLAQALVVLTHEAEQLRSPTTSAAELECSALQHVRPLVAAAWGPALANEIALLAWQVAYPRLSARFRSPECRDGGTLDRNPRSSMWP